MRKIIIGLVLAVSVVGTLEKSYAETKEEKEKRCKAETKGHPKSYDLCMNGFKKK